MSKGGYVPSFTEASQMKAQKQTRDAHAGRQTGVAQKGGDAKAPSVGLDSFGVKNALSAPKRDTERGMSGKAPSIGLDSMGMSKAMSTPKTGVQSGIHKGDQRTAPKAADQFGNDKSTESGEFESAPEQSTASTGAGWGHQQVQSGTFESNPEESRAHTGGSWGSQQVQSGTFESNPEPSRAQTGGNWGAQEIESGTFESNPEEGSY
eukprot:TRINITY_DN22685_c0_g1_i1.p1 TRINITY_DN22685_c0_g1~~TRINITY_DN22685_c0_g1_i1.p1  ORF type:complete len:207 (-),score=82.34 TRINITY_DN22685_c0_g1_i1:263-883(-)